MPKSHRRIWLRFPCRAERLLGPLEYLPHLPVQGGQLPKFLLSRERNVDAFCDSNRSKRRPPAIELYPKGYIPPHFRNRERSNVVQEKNQASKVPEMRSIEQIAQATAEGVAETGSGCNIHANDQKDSGGIETMGYSLPFASGYGAIFRRFMGLLFVSRVWPTSAVGRAIGPT
jgi:hypothetical protein